MIYDTASLKTMALLLFYSLSTGEGWGEAL